MLVQGRVLDEVPFHKAFYHSGLFSTMLLELAVCLVHPLPFVSFDLTINKFAEAGVDAEVYSSDAFISVLMFARLPIYMPRLIAELSGMKNEKTRIIGTLNGVKVDFVLIIKDLIQSNLKVLMLLVSALIFTYSYAFVIFERVHPDSKVVSYENAIWLTIITMTTVGYGDLFPVTVCGRAIAVITAITAVIMTALAVNTVIVRLSLTREETKVLDFIDQMEQRQQMKLAAAVFIQRGYRSWSKAVAMTSSKVETIQLMARDIDFAMAGLQFRELHSIQMGGGISTDVPLTITESQVIMKRLEDDVGKLNASVATLTSLIETRLGVGVGPTSLDPPAPVGTANSTSGSGRGLMFPAPEAGVPPGSSRVHQRR